jgi:hypothetical protein
MVEFFHFTEKEKKKIFQEIKGILMAYPPGRNPIEIASFRACPKIS